MNSTDSTTRTVVTLSQGARVGLVVALTLLVAAGYLLWSPIQLYPTDGFPTKCGMAASPPSDDLGRAICGDIHFIRQWQAGAVAVAALVIALGSVYAFGLKRREESLIGSESLVSTGESTVDESTTTLSNAGQASKTDTPSS